MLVARNWVCCKAKGRSKGSRDEFVRDILLLLFVMFALKGLF